MHGPRHLRLVGGDDAARRAADVASENRAAAMQVDLDPTDPRWVLAVRAQAALQGTTLTPERRERVMATARMLGIRPFEANVIIALVQHHARLGGTISDAAPTISMVPTTPREHPWPQAAWLALAIGAGIALAATMIAWLVTA